MNITATRFQVDLSIHLFAGRDLPSTKYMNVAGFTVSLESDSFNTGVLSVDSGAVLWESEYTERLPVDISELAILELAFTTFD